MDGQYPANAAGETYGTLWAQYVVGYPPDLIAVVGVEGEDGYMSTPGSIRAPCGPAARPS